VIAFFALALYLFVSFLPAERGVIVDGPFRRRIVLDRPATLTTPGGERTLKPD
jgi:hypothetical protein